MPWYAIIVYPGDMRLQSGRQRNARNSRVHTGRIENETWLDAAGNEFDAGGYRAMFSKVQFSRLTRWTARKSRDSGFERESRASAAGEFRL
jgi:hypothetical protein